MGPDSDEWQEIDDIISDGLDAVMDGKSVVVEYDEGAIYARNYCAADEWLCADCACWIANGDLSGLDADNPKAAEGVRQSCDSLPAGCILSDCGDDSATVEAGPFDACTCCGRAAGNNLLAYGYFSDDDDDRAALK